ncbi:MAG TPA: hypothetical protein VEM32_12230, partial [Geobacteraceae bacterium]|nr:hypothetical protein [Geobacteraceae bacterium]
MEPMVILSVGLVIYCGWLTSQDVLRDLKRERRHACCVVTATRKKLSPVRSRPPIVSSSRGRGDGGGGHWPALLKGSA